MNISTWHRKVHSADAPQEPGFYPVLRQVSEDNSQDLLLQILVFNGSLWLNHDCTPISEQEDDCLLAWGPVLSFRNATLASLHARQALI
jgi:hypothetical protein